MVACHRPAHSRPNLTVLYARQGFICGYINIRYYCVHIILQRNGMAANLYSELYIA